VLFRRGLNARQVQVWLGHHSRAFTLAVCVHLLSDDLPDADPFAVGEVTEQHEQQIEFEIDDAARSAIK
jgi:hypothetical protein